MGKKNKFTPAASWLRLEAKANRLSSCTAWPPINSFGGECVTDLKMFSHAMRSTSRVLAIPRHRDISNSRLKTLC